MLRASQKRRAARVLATGLIGLVVCAACPVNTENSARTAREIYSASIFPVVARVDRQYTAKAGLPLPTDVVKFAGEEYTFVGNSTLVVRQGNQGLLATAKHVLKEICDGLASNSDRRAYVVLPNSAQGDVEIRTVSFEPGICRDPVLGSEDVAVMSVQFLANELRYTQVSLARLDDGSATYLAGYQLNPIGRVQYKISDYAIPTQYVGDGDPTLTNIPKLNLYLTPYLTERGQSGGGLFIKHSDDTMSFAGIETNSRSYSDGTSLNAPISIGFDFRSIWMDLIKEMKIDSAAFRKLIDLWLNTKSKASLESELDAQIKQLPWSQKINVYMNCLESPNLNELYVCRQVMEDCLFSVSDRRHYDRKYVEASNGFAISNQVNLNQTQTVALRDLARRAAPSDTAIGPNTQRQFAAAVLLSTISLTETGTSSGQAALREAASYLNPNNTGSQTGLEAAVRILGLANKNDPSDRKTRTEFGRALARLGTLKNDASALWKASSLLASGNNPAKLVEARDARRSAIVLSSMPLDEIR